jgi:hypothetical protein
MKSLLLILILVNGAGSASAGPVISYRSTVNDQRSSVIDINRQPPNSSRQPLYDSTKGLNRQAFYKAMQEENKALVNAQLKELKSAPAEIKNAFMGAMTMKSAGIGGSPTTKLKLFKQGHNMLEAAIKQDPNNAEYRFLRLMIQENAPGILGYKDDEQKDSELIRKSYRSLSGELQQTIADYSKKSKVLKLKVS